MRLDTVSQILDAVSFLLVTPEFLGKDTLRRFRATCQRSLSIFSSFLSDKYLNNVLGYEILTRLPRSLKVALSIVVWLIVAAIPIRIGT
jgi:hypothetical protein